MSHKPVVLVPVLFLVLKDSLRTNNKSLFLSLKVKSFSWSLWSWSLTLSLQFFVNKSVRIRKVLQHWTSQSLIRPSAEISCNSTHSFDHCMLSKLFLHSIFFSVSSWICLRTVVSFWGHIVTRSQTLLLLNCNNAWLFYSQTCCDWTIKLWK